LYFTEIHRWIDGARLLLHCERFLQTAPLQPACRIFEDRFTPQADAARLTAEG
jgi:hypothetical protein